jgi:phosphoribosylformimino-5-aminoimidazole carboxamide ribotide isomerase
MEIIPAIDIIDGKCVRLTEGDYATKKIYSDDPLEVAKRFEEAGLTRLHLVDLDGAKAGQVKNWKTLETISAASSMKIDFGGGIKTKEELQKVFDSGAFLATVGSIAVRNEQTFLNWIGKFGAERFLLGADVRDEMIAVNGWSELTNISVYDLLEKYMNRGIRQVFCTDVNKDGKLEGPATELYKNLISAFPSMQIIASGGISSLEDLHQLRSAGCSGAIVGKAIYEGKIGLKELAEFQNSAVKK